MPALPQLRTIVYIDGFNFYYGAVKKTPYRWLDLATLFGHVLGPQNSIVKIKYFTARVQPTPRDPDIHVRQDAYLRALAAHCPTVEVHFGHFLRHRVRMENATPPPPTVEVWKNEEKGSDVNLALHLLDDAWRNRFDCAVIVSNDSDLATAMQMVNSQRKLLGLVTPGAPKRGTSYELRQYARFVRPIREWMLRASLLPDPIPGTSIAKPSGW